MAEYKFLVIDFMIHEISTWDIKAAGDHKYKMNKSQTR